ncbi:MAG TPA: DegT/DnrJ/EryC1/StrS family aminotransferase [Thermoanaerobaculia bacterium]
MTSVADRPIPVLDLTRYDAALQEEISRRVSEVFATGRFVMGAAVEAFEKDFASAMQVKHAIGVSSGTDALLVALMALGVKPGDEIITSPFTFFASAGVVARLNATPVFVDIESESFNLDPSKLEAAITPRTKAIQPVHLYGQVADMDPIREIATRRGIPILEDACQAVGATYGGKPAGGLGTLAAFSFYPTKNLGAAGDAGAVTTDDDGLAALVKSLRIHGSTVTYHHDHVGGNFRIDALQAVVLHAKLPRLAGWNEKRRAVAARYGERLAEPARAGKITLPRELPGRRHVYHQYVVRVPNRDKVKARLAEKGIGSSVFYPVPLNDQECFEHLLQRGKFPLAAKAAAEVLALPIYPELTEAEIDRVAEAVASSI